MKTLKLLIKTSYRICGQWTEQELRSGVCCVVSMFVVRDWKTSAHHQLQWLRLTVIYRRQDVCLCDGTAIFHGHATPERGEEGSAAVAKSVSCVDDY